MQRSKCEVGKTYRWKPDAGGIFWVKVDAKFKGHARVSIVNVVQAGKPECSVNSEHSAFYRSLSALK